MNKKFLAVMITASMMLIACSSCGNLNDGEIETASETTAAETTADEYDGPVRHGNYITFGHYEQDEDESNGPEPIEWKIISEEDGKVFLMSKYILDYQPYNTEQTDVTWETCSIRQWLNNDFLNAAFDASEQELILTVTNSNPDTVTALRTIEGGNDTVDRVFLLSYEEADTLFTDDSQREVGDCGWWWLRSAGRSSHHAAVVLTMGEVYHHGHLVSFNAHDHGVRPVLWLSLDAVQ